MAENGVTSKWTRMKDYCWLKAHDFRSRSYLEQNTKIIQLYNAISDCSIKIQPRLGREVFGTSAS